ncbi:hypothetical protein [Streptomyces sp. NPDC002205]|uniref:hypothetical protein n=1 Tax=Streptomyces sp. NPDC002205 TaxID=3154411 RepID=UPI0033275DA8
MLRSAGGTWVRVLAVLGLAISGLAVTAPASYAGTSCSYPYCSETYNQTSLPVYVAHNWCGDKEWLIQSAPPCGAKSSDYWLAAGQHTDSHQDWDTFRVDAYWCYKFQRYSVIWGWESVETVDRRNQSAPEWVRVHNDETAYIIKQSSSSC